MVCSQVFGNRALFYAMLLCSIDLLYILGNWYDIQRLTVFLWCSSLHTRPYSHFDKIGFLVHDGKR